MPTLWAVAMDPKSGAFSVDLSPAVTPPSTSLPERFEAKRRSLEVLAGLKKR